MNKSKNLILLLMLFLSFTACQTIKNYDLAIVNAKILDVKTNAFLLNKTILISNGKIATITDYKKFKATKTIDAKGKLLTPSFVDPHIHPTDVFGDYDKAPDYLPKDSLQILRK